MHVKHPHSMRASMVAVLSKFTCVTFLAVVWVGAMPRTALASWTNAGEKSLTTNFADGTTFSVNVGAKVRVSITGHVEKDTETVGETSTQVADAQKQWKLKIGTTVVQSGSGLAHFDIPIPAGTAVGTSVTYTISHGDTRETTDARHDPFQDVMSFTITVVNACPTGLTAAMTDLLPARPNANETFGSWKATMTATGDPPVGKDNWNGYSVHEVVDNTVIQPNRFAEGFAIVFNNGSSFLIGSAGANKFEDFHNVQLVGDWNVLQAGIQTGTVTSDQKYVCSSTKNYPFVITRTFDRKTLADRIKVDISK